MTKEERNELNRIRQMRGRYEPEAQEPTPTYKDIKKTRVWRLDLFGRLVEIRVSNSNK